MTNIVSWNVNGLRAVTPKLEGKSLESLFKKYNADIFCFQETKISSLEWVDDKLVHVPGYESFWSFSKKKKGYSGVATFVKKGLTLDAKNVFGEKRFDEEGRVIMTDHGQYILFNVYFPNGGSTDDRRQYKHDFYDWFRETCAGLISQGREIIVVGDVNTAHTELDTHRPDDTVNGYLPKEREWLTSFLAKGFVDTYRHVHGDKRAYSWWDPKGTARIDNKGWRIDFGFITTTMVEKLAKAEYLPNQFGSDHCPFSMSLSTTITLEPHKTPVLSSDIFKPKQAKISSFFMRKPPPEEIEEAGSDDETGISVYQSQSQLGEDNNTNNNNNNSNTAITTNNSDNMGDDSKMEKVPDSTQLNEKPTLLSVPTKVKTKHRPPSKKNPAEQLEKERNDLIEQGVIKIDENNKISENDTNSMQIEANKEENNTKKVPAASGPKKNLNFLAELNNKLAKPNLKRKASEAELPNKESSDIELDNTEEDPTGVENKNKRRKITK